MTLFSLCLTTTCDTCFVIGIEPTNCAREPCLPLYACPSSPKASSSRVGPRVGFNWKEANFVPTHNGEDDSSFLIIRQPPIFGHSRTIPAGTLTLGVHHGANSSFSHAGGCTSQGLDFTVRY
eukprot:scaffold1402_cov155-Amphora_coffeaeformis.AAC.1